VIFLRYVYVLALAAWLGGMIVIATIAAPSAFAVMQARDGDAGRPVAGAVVGDVLRRFNLVAYGAGTAMIATLVGMALLGPRPRPYAPRLLVIGTMLVVALVSGTVVTGRIEGLQREIKGPVSALDPSDPRRATFGRLHAVSVLLMALDAAGALVLLYWEARR
jgi:hypothetical protein